MSIFGTVNISSFTKATRMGRLQVVPPDFVTDPPTFHEDLPEQHRPANYDVYYAYLADLDWHLQVLAENPTNAQIKFVVVVGDESEFTTWNAGSSLVTVVPEGNVNDYATWPMDKAVEGGPGANPKEKWEWRVDHFRHSPLAAVDAKTASLIAAGFEYNSKTFCLSPNAQVTYLGMHAAKDILTYPVLINTLDDKTVESLADSSEVEAFFAASVAAVRSHLDGGTALKQAIEAATDEVSIDAVEDNR
jgi:hypothetical protein